MTGRPSFSWVRSTRTPDRRNGRSPTRSPSTSGSLISRTWLHSERMRAVADGSTVQSSLTQFVPPKTRVLRSWDGVHERRVVANDRARRVSDFLTMTIWPRCGSRSKSCARDRAPIPLQLTMRSNSGSTSSRLARHLFAEDLAASRAETPDKIIEVNGRIHQRDIQCETRRECGGNLGPKPCGHRVARPISEFRFHRVRENFRSSSIETPLWTSRVRSRSVS